MKHTRVNFQKWVGGQTSSPTMLVYAMIVSFPSRWKYDCNVVVSESSMFVVH